MSLPLIPVKVVAVRANGTPVAGARVRAVLTVGETDNGVIVPSNIEGVTNGSGELTLNLWPNSRGINGSQYRVVVDLAGSLYFSGLISVPEVPDSAWPVLMDALINQPPYPPMSVAQAAQAAAVAAAVEAEGHAATLAAALPAITAAEAAALDAAASRDASFALGPKYTTEALGRAAVADGAVFLVVGSGDVAAYEYRRVNSGSSTLIAAYPAASAITKPKWASLKNGWPDTFFRYINLATQQVDGSNVWWWNTTGFLVTEKWSLVDNSFFPGAKALRNANVGGSTQLTGPRIGLDSIDAKPGDTVTIYALVNAVGASGYGVMAGKWNSGLAAGGAIGAQTGLQRDDTGSSVIPFSAGPLLVHLTEVVPAGARAFGFYPYVSASGYLDILALWAFKGAASAGPAWPVLDAGIQVRPKLAALAGRFASAEQDLNGAVSARTVVTQTGSPTVALAVTSPSAVAYGLTFCGWAEGFTPQGVSFNAIKVALISQTVTTPASRWKELRLFVRVGAAPFAAGTVVAVATAKIDAAVSSLSNITFVLTDPLTGAVKTLTNADLGAAYIVGVYALNSAGERGACGMPAGTTAGNAGQQGYYETTYIDGPEDGVWALTSGGSNVRLGFEHQLLTSPVVSTVQVPVTAFAQQITADVAAGLASTQASVNGAVKGLTVVTQTGSPTVALAVSGQGSIPYDSEFYGWCETFTPQGVSFNAIKLKEIAQTQTDAASIWHALHIVVRTGATPLASGTVVAIGSALIPSTPVVNDVVILLRDPVTGAVKTITNADLTTKYMVGVYAKNISGGKAACGMPTGTTVGNDGQQAYYTSAYAGDPKTGAWAPTSSGSNVRLGFEHLLLTSPVESTISVPTEAFKAQFTGATDPAPEIVMPVSMYALQGVQANLYFDNVLIGDPTKYDVVLSKTASSGTMQQLNECFRWVPAGAVSSGALTMKLKDKVTFVDKASAAINLRAAASSAGAGTTKKLMLVGDSLINGSAITQHLADTASADAMALTLIGARGYGSNWHEGRSGWSVPDYTTAGRVNYYKFTVSGVSVFPLIDAEYTNNGQTFRFDRRKGSTELVMFNTSGVANPPAASGVLTKVFGTGDATIAFSAFESVPGNPFWIGGVVNVPQYLTDYSLAAPDWFMVALGINDIFSQTTDSGAQSAAVAFFTSLDTLITSAKAVDGSIKVGLVIPSPPSFDQDSFGLSEAFGTTRARNKRNILIWARELVTRYAGLEASRIYICPSNLNLDTVNNMNRAASAAVNSRSSVNVARQNNGVHPHTTGYQQIADAIWAFLKFHA